VRLISRLLIQVEKFGEDRFCEIYFYFVFINAEVLTVISDMTFMLILRSRVLKGFSGLFMLEE